MNDLICIAPQDLAAVALRPLKAGETVHWNGGEITLKEDIPMGHKIALREIHRGEAVIKYGFPIGEATADIPAGSHIHTHNLHTLLKGEQEYEWHPSHPEVRRMKPAVFRGYPRAKGRPGVRNELWILPTVGCVNDVARALEQRAQRLAGGNVEGVHAFTHPYGCSQLGDDQDNTRKILANLATHPNAGGVLLLGLGCENSGIEQIRPWMGDYDESRIRFLVCQETEDELETGIRLLEELAGRMRKDRREECGADQLVIGLKCGGSDGLSGITANPTIGVFSDLLTGMGGTTILTEVPEMFGAETILMNRCDDEALFQKTVHLINDFKSYFSSYHMPVYENPSPGNKAGGITTLEDKALGCTQKSGSAPVRGVLAYGEKVTATGLNLLSAPGNDLVASTALASSGAQIVLFSTGRGTPFGCPVPTLKIATNTPLAEKKKHWIDFNAGRLLEDRNLEELGAELMEKVLRTASGEPARNEENGFHDLAIFKQGVTL
ncbi:MAG: altronate dehydratase [Clostridia bacterium]|jgi:altronate hydrolase|nr:altronate dehydratase [Clostridia bacterium]